jgi:hypothetical protein
MPNTPGAPTLMKQMPNRVGNIAKHTPNKTPPAGTRTGTNVSTPKGNQGAPKASGNIYPVGNKVSVSKPKDNCGCNDSYRNSSYLK